MRKAVVLTPGIILAAPAFLWAQPDPQDSIILESKTVAPGNGHPYFVIGVSITNKDSLSGLVLSLLEYSTNGAAYATLTHPRTFEGVVTVLSGNFTSGTADFSSYHGDSPDTFLLTGSGSSLEPPNSTRKGIWAIKFDSVKFTLGCVDFDSTAFPPNSAIGFIDQLGRRVAVNFVKSRIYVDVPSGCCQFEFCLYSPSNELFCGPGGFCAYDFSVSCEGDWAFSIASGPGNIDSITGEYTFQGQCAGTYPVTVQAAGRPSSPCGCDSIRIAQCSFNVLVGATKGDLNCDHTAGPTDEVLLLRAVFLGEAPPAGMAAGDLDCSGAAEPPDVVVLLNAVFQGSAYPC